ncbi:Myosin [Wickerhamomyces ciferrii]|uniref:Myosin n=1 Tax=Wickerhamomyces ciferrii (strain ATCC 14091 / BCRC 22168 / CBS 111 / JCM 3599 / NBRC 0793 / NRRL Y-1031 F-60-10) TaxID=1206466 RepID=K0KIR2_WICCF|nr:Myosin [Wickerhamomyces ciferrii]CCH45105.1 Myosin [Wickerhamomyces ciferrii]
MPRPDPFAALYETDDKEDTKSILSYAVSKNSTANDDNDTQSIASSNYDYRSPFRSGSSKRTDRIKPSEHSKHNKISVPSKFFNKVETKNQKELEKLAQQEEKLNLLKQQYESEVKLAEEAEKKLKADQETRRQNLEKLKKEASEKAKAAKIAQQEAEDKLKQKTKEIKQSKEETKDTKDKTESIESLSDVNADEDSLYQTKKTNELNLPKGSKTEDLAQSEADELLDEEEDEVPLNKEHNSPIKSAIANEVPLTAGTAGTDLTAGSDETELTKPDTAEDFKKDPFNKKDEKANDISGLRKASITEAKLDLDDVKDKSQNRRKSIAQELDEEVAETKELEEAKTLEEKLGSDAKEPPLKKKSDGFKNPFGANSETEHHKVDKTDVRGLRRASAAEAKLNEEDAKASLQGRKKSAAEIADEEQVEAKEIEEADALERTLSQSEARQEAERKKSTSNAATNDNSLLGKATSVFTNPFGSSGEKVTSTKDRRSSKDENARGLRRASAAEAKLNEEDAKASLQGRKKSVAEIADEEQAEEKELEEAVALEKTLSQSEAKQDLKNLRKASAAEARLDVETAKESTQGRRKSVAEELDEEEAETKELEEVADLESKLGKDDDEEGKSIKTSKSSGITGRATPQKKKLFGLFQTTSNVNGNGDGQSDNASILSKPASTVYDSIFEANKKHDDKLRSLQNKNKLALQKIEVDYALKIKKLKSSISEIEERISENESKSQKSIDELKIQHADNLKKFENELEESKKSFFEETELKIKEKSKEIEDLKKQQESSSKDLEELEKLQVESSEKLQVFQADIQKLKSEIRAEDSKLDELSKEKDLKTKELTKLNDEKESLLEKLKEAQLKNSKSGEILSKENDESFQSQIDSLNSDIEKLTIDLTKSIKTTTDVTVSKNKLESNLTTKEIDESKEQSNISKLNTLKERAETTDNHQTSKIADGEKELKTLKEDQVNDSKSVSKTSVKDDSKTSNDAALKEREELQKKVLEARAKREAIQKELENVKNSDYEFFERESIAEL